MSMIKKLKVVELFAGAGGYALGLAWLAAGIGLAEWRLKHRSVKMLLG